jgi:hypothetical protein
MYNFIQVLLCFGLHLELEREEGELIPLFSIRVIIQQHIYIFTFGILNIANDIKLFRKSLVLSYLAFRKTKLYKLTFAILKRFELLDDVSWESLSLSLTDSFRKALLQLFLQEDVQFCLKLVFAGCIKLLSASNLFLEFFNTKTEDGLL